MYRSILIVFVFLAGTTIAQYDAQGRGFGGFHGGGFGGGSFGGFHAGGFDAGGFHAGGFGGDSFGGSHAGGFDAGGFHAGGFGGDGFGGSRAGGFDASGFHSGGYGDDLGGYHAGGFDTGGYHGGGFSSDLGGYRGGGFDAGGFRSGDLGTSVNRGELNSFLHLPTDGGMSAAGGTWGGRGAVAGPEGAAAWRGGATGHVYQGPMGTTVAHGAAGVQGIAAGPGGIAGGSRMASGTVVKGPEGNVYARGGTASRGFAAGPGGVAAGGSVTARRGSATAGGAHYHSSTYYHSQAISAQHWCNGWGCFTPAWSTVHPWAWCPAGYTAATWATAAWNAATWSTVNSTIAIPATPVYYDYGDNITYQGDTVYYGAQPVGTAQQYYQEADNLANLGANAPSGEDVKWLPLGTFGLMATGQKVPDMVFQLAINPSGIIRGNYYDQISETTLPVHGAVDKKSQRAAWHIGNNKNLVVETGLYNLTLKQSTALVHTGPDSSEQYLMVRLDQPNQSSSSQN